MSIHEKAVALEHGEESLSHLPSESSRPSSALPAKAVIKIRPARRWRKLDFSELWDHHELFYFLVWRDLKTRYKQTVLGAGWVILQPLLMTLIFTFFLGRLMRIPTNGVPYSVFAYAGLLPWAFFTNAVISGSYSLVSNAPLITKVYFPRFFLPAAAVFVRLADFGVAAVILLILLLYYGFEPSWRMLLFPALVLELTLLALGCGLWSAALNVKYRDIGTLMPVVLQLWMFTSPIIYASSVVPERWRPFYVLNPLAGIIEGMRACLFNTKLDWGSIGSSAMITMLLLVYATYFFQIADESFADVI